MTEKLRFDQRHGLAALPTQLRADEVSNELRAKVWAGLHILMEDARALRDFGNVVIAGTWYNLLYRWHFAIEHRASDDFNPDYDHSVKKVRGLIYDSDWGELYTFLEFVIGYEDMRHEREMIAHALKSARAAWRLAGDEIVPVTSEEQAEAVTTAIQQVGVKGPEGAKAHLRQSSKAIAAGDWAGSVRESIHAVEAIARTMTGAGTLSDALRELQRSATPIHPALAKGFSALYGYSSDQSGIRHALLEDAAAAVTENEALFMYGACAFFCQYLLNIDHIA